MFFNFEILDYGIFDSNFSKLKNITKSKKRTVKKYEIEFVDTSTDRLSYIDSTSASREIGTFICAKPGQVRHSHLPCRCYFLHITTEDENLISLLNSTPNFFTIYNVEKVTHIYREILRSNNNSLKDHFALQSNVTRLLSYIFSHAPEVDIHKNQSFFIHQKALQKSTSYIKQHFNEKLTLEKLARVAELSPSYFHKLFCELFDQTPNEYILDWRISQAKLLLVSTNKSILQISEDCGFSSQSYFNNAFRKAVELSPLQYKKQMLKNIEL
jgi:AraC-like DNA-binding protein